MVLWELKYIKQKSYEYKLCRVCDSSQKMSKLIVSHERHVLIVNDRHLGTAFLKIFFCG